MAKTICLTTPEVRRLLDYGEALIVRPCTQAIKIYESTTGTHIEYAKEVHPALESGWIAWFYRHPKPNPESSELAEFTKKQYRKGFESPLGQPGQRVGLREAWAEEYHLGRWTGRYFYKSDGNAPPDEFRSEWRSPATMPSWAIRHAFRDCTVVSVECRKVESITEEEAVAAGCDPQPADCELCQLHLCSQHQPPLGQFHNAWRDRYGKKYPFDTACGWFCRVKMGGNYA